MRAKLDRRKLRKFSEQENLRVSNEEDISHLLEKYFPPLFRIILQHYTDKEIGDGREMFLLGNKQLNHNRQLCAWAGKIEQSRLIINIAEFGKGGGFGEEGDFQFLIENLKDNGGRSKWFSSFLNIWGKDEKETIVLGWDSKQPGKLLLFAETFQQGVKDILEATEGN